MIAFHIFSMRTLYQSTFLIKNIVASGYGKKRGDTAEC
ncbi:hypothetical protein [Enterobacter hormaechei]|nr:hypothetical protein [Enterobacter hormaechei]